MASVRFTSLGKSLRSRSSFSIAAALIALAASTIGAGAKEPSLTAIELYDGASGAAYIQLADVLVNGKAELKSCASAETAPIEKSAYGKLPKVGLAPGGILERGNDGVLRYGTGDGKSGCVVPDGIKFEHNASFTPASMADSADLRGRAVATGSDGARRSSAIEEGCKAGSRRCARRGIVRVFARPTALHPGELAKLPH